jgi:hypothetical protein
VTPLVTRGSTIHEIETINGLKIFYKRSYISETGQTF